MGLIDVGREERGGRSGGEVGRGPGVGLGLRVLGFRVLGFRV
jgi:hypothetical protein